MLCVLQLLLCTFIAIISHTNGQVEPPIVNASGLYYIATAHNSFSSQNIICNSSIPNATIANNCYVACPLEDVCSNATIQCKSFANCMVNCGASSCKNINIDSSNSYSTNLYCAGSNSCDTIKLLAMQPNITNSTIDITCDCSDCLTSSSCSHFDITTTDNISVTCIGDKSCLDIGLNSGLGTDLKCMDSRSCNTVTINANNGVSIGCLASYACNTLNVTSKGGNFNATCHGTSSCSGSTFISSDNLAATATATLDCIGFESCQQMTLSTDASDININCSTFGCPAAKIRAHTADSKLSLTCNDPSACTNMDVMADGIVMLTCFGDQSCVDADFYTQSKQVQNNRVSAVSTVICDGDDACNLLKFISISDIDVTCLGTHGCVTSTIQSITGNITLRCGNDKRHDIESCKESTITSGSGIDVYCEGDNGCSATNITANGELQVHCNGIGADICSAMNINSNNTKASNTFNCGGTGSCKDMTVNTQSNVINFECIDTTSCQTVQIMANNRNSKLTMNCNGMSSCDSFIATTNGSISMICAGDRGCRNANISGYGDLLLDCSRTNDSSICTEMNINMFGNEGSNTLICGDSYSEFVCSKSILDTYAKKINITCSDYGCNDNNIIANNIDSKLIMQCNGIDSCSHLNIDTVGEIAMHCDDAESCDYAQIVTKGQQTQFINCTADYACPNLDVTTKGNLSIYCHGVSACSGKQFASFNVESLSISCQGDAACPGANIIVANSIDMACMGNQACTETNIKGNVNDLYLDCNGGGSCDALHLLQNNVTNVILNCVGGNQQIGSCDNLYINAMNKVSINCNGSCFDNTINANNADSVYIECDTRSFGDIDYIVGCNKLNINATNAKMVDIYFLGKYAATNGIINASNAKTLNITFESDIPYDYENDTNIISLIDGASSITLQCYNYGCYFGNFESWNGLKDMNITFNGQCKCKTIEDCIDEWDLQCNAGSNSFNGDKCNHGTNCCHNQSVDHIQHNFEDYTKLICPSGGGDSNGNKLSGGAIAGIVSGGLVGVALIVGIIYYFTTKKQSEPLLVND